LLIVTALYTGVRISELLALTWGDVDLCPGVVHVRAQLSPAHHGGPARRVAPKTASGIRDVPLVTQLAALFRDAQRAARFTAPGDYIFATSKGTPLGHRNGEGRALQRAAAVAGIAPAPRYHDLRHTFASHLIIDRGLDVAQVSRMLGHASVATTLNIYTHLFDDARHATEIRTRMAGQSVRAAARTRRRRRGQRRRDRPPDRPVKRAGGRGMTHART
jgi:integrase